MPHTIDGDSHISRYLAAQPELNTSLEYNNDSGVLYDASMTGKSDARTALVAGAGMSRSTASKYAQFVGPGMLSGLMVAPHHLEHDKHKAPGASLTSQLTKLSDALRLSNKHTEMAWIGPTKVDIDRSAAVPRHHGLASMLEVDDGLAGVEGGAEVSVILPMKICGALASMGYDSGTVHNVGKLVRNNMMTVDAPASDKPMAFTEIEGEVKKMLEGFFKSYWPNAKRVRSVKFNSNEPVLLINDFGRCGGVKLGSVVTEVIEQLQNKHNVWPVRVYAGSFIEGDEADGPEFSVTLLNVQNTEIGGPSMIQLLDHPCNTLGWNGCMRREVWNGRDLLERFEKAETAKDKAAALPEKMQEVSIADKGAGVVKNKSAAAASAEADNQAKAPDEAEPREVEHDEAEPEEVEADDAEPDEVEPDEPGYSYDDPHKDRPAVRYPTWDHSTKSESLIDLIGRQGAKDNPGAQPGDSPKSVEGSMDPEAERKKRTESSASEDFVVL